MSGFPRNTAGKDCPIHLANHEFAMQNRRRMRNPCGKKIGF